MKELICNPTPVRTSNHFGMNHFRMTDIQLPQRMEVFRNAEVRMENGGKPLARRNTDILQGRLGQELEDCFQKGVNHVCSISPEQEETVHVVYSFDSTNRVLQNEVSFHAMQKLDFVICYESQTDEVCFHNGRIHVKVEKGVCVHGIIYQNMNEESSHFEAVHADLEEGAEFFLTFVDLGAKNSVVHYGSELVGDYAKNQVCTVYFGDGRQKKDFNYISEIFGREATTDIQMQGALKGKSRKHFKGTIDFKKGCKKAKGNEYEYCFLLSEHAASLSLPMLLCTEEDVEGNHGTASGKMDEQVLFYLMSRGISRQDAVKLLVNARFRSIIGTIPYPELREGIQKEIDRRI